MKLVAASPSVIAPRRAGSGPRGARSATAGPANRRPSSASSAPTTAPPRVVRRFRGDGRARASGDGEVAAGPEATGPAPDGDYAFTVTVRDRAGNLAVAPRRDTPSAAWPARAPGVSVRSFTPARAARASCPPGSLRHARGRARSTAASTSWSRGSATPSAIRRAGGSAAASASASRATRATGVYLVRVRAGATAPSGRSRSPGCRSRSGRPSGRARWWCCRRSSWQGLNPVDDDLDGFADTLPSAGSVRLDRPFAGGGPAAALRRRDRRRCCATSTASGWPTT